MSILGGCNASPHTLQYSCLDNLRVLAFVSAEHDMRAKTLLPKGANRTNSQPSSQDRCQSHWYCRAVFKSVRLCLLWQKYCTHPFLYILYAHVRAYISICNEFDFGDNRCPHQPEQVITVLHRDFSGLVSKAWLRQKRHSVEGLKQERRSTFVIKKRMETKRFRLLVAASISWMSFLLMFESCCDHSLWLPTLFSFYILYYRERQVQKEREEDVKFSPCVCLVHFFKQVLDDYLSRW